MPKANVRITYKVSLPRRDGAAGHIGGIIAVLAQQVTGEKVDVEDAD